jgi:hypothetical protein
MGQEFPPDGLSIPPSTRTKASERSRQIHLAPGDTRWQCRRVDKGFKREVRKRDRGLEALSQLSRKFQETTTINKKHINNNNIQ